MVPQSALFRSADPVRPRQARVRLDLHQWRKPKICSTAAPAAVTEASKPFRAMEDIMESRAHVYFNWAKERIDEMDAVVASLESKATQLTADSRTAAEKIVGDLRAKREEFMDNVKKQADA